MSTDEAFDLTTEDLRGKTPEELRDIVTLAEAHVRALHMDERGGLRDLDDAEQAAFEIAMQVRNTALDMLDKHTEIRKVLERRPKAVERALASMGTRDEDPYAEVRRMSFSELRDRALRILDKDRVAPLTPAQQDQVERTIRRDADIARRVIVTENETYRSAWMKISTQPNGSVLLSDEERGALQRYAEYRAMSESTTTAGGFGIPVKVAA